MALLARFGLLVLNALDAFGDFVRFSGRALAWVMPGLSRRRLQPMLDQFFDVGTRSVPVVMVTGLFVGGVLAVQAADQFKAIGLIAQMGTIVNLSVLRELGPVLAAVLLAGRVGGGLTAELGTMRVTEQIDALRAMGADPIRVLVVPRFLACVLLIPVLVFYACFMGILGGYVVSVYLFGANSAEFWRNAADSVMTYDIVYGPIKSVFFGAVIALICCYKGFRCEAGAAGVGRACTEAFVASCMAILGLNLFLGMFLNTVIEMIWGLRVLLG
ncbi:MAG: MlaE family lipid ABC transporter permease subunit [Planctomycetes bacterium]|jgi:phospholipid/cholesterol/gamma-HCH transport system permease protein|nr:ABC transporter permease [Phycisphaerae bacterium]NBB95083.1 MlaE family lipid ABC transporter permease subunit [Planctomycetota bacterium]